MVARLVENPLWFQGTTMNRRLAFIVAVLLVAVGLGGWALASSHHGRITAGRPVVRSRSLRTERSAQNLQVLRLERQLTRLRRRLRTDEHTLRVTLHVPYIPRFRFGPVAGRHRLFAPEGARITNFRVIPRESIVPAEVVVSWRHGSKAPDPPLETGLVVWQEQRRGEVGTKRTKWRAEYQIDLPEFHWLAAFVGPTWDQRMVPTYDDLGISFQTGDATGDGHPDVMVVDASSGSAGCAIYRVLMGSPNGVRQIFYRDHCEGSIQFANGMLRIEGAVWPKGCRATHGCGGLTTFRRWNGSGWDVVSRHVQIY
jgi:hypothetical protein